MLPLLLGTGCSISSLLNELEREYDKTEDLVCDCPSDYFQLSCESLVNAQLDYDDPCVAEALEVAEDASAEVLSCEIDTRKAYNECLKDVVECSNIETYFNSCQEERAAILACPDLTNSVKEALYACP